LEAADRVARERELRRLRRELKLARKALRTRVTEGDGEIEGDQAWASDSPTIEQI
jgi:hypothetical protein